MRTSNLALGALVAAVAISGCGPQVKPSTGPAPGARAGAKAGALPEHPTKIKYPELQYQPPKPADHRVVLANGLRCYLVPDRTVPAIRVEAFIDAGERQLPKEKRGLAKLAGELMRSGGIEGLDARALDAKLDELAVDIDAGFDLNRGHASLWTLSKHADEALRLFAGVLTKPVFADDRIRRAKDELKDEIEHRDDEPQAVLDHEVFKLVYGPESALALRESKETVDAVTRDDLVAFHRAHVSPKNVILAVAGDFDRAEMQKKLESLLVLADGSGWGKDAAKAGPVDSVDGGKQQGYVFGTAPSGVYVLDRPLNQGYVEMVELGIKLNDPDEIALQVMNFILGGGSFTSRITKRVRNDEGLAYSAGSYVHPTRPHPGLIGVAFQSKAPSTAFAAKICVEELARIRSTPVAPEELERARRSMIDRFPERFATAHGTAAVLAEAEFNERPADYLSTYRTKVAAVTAAEVQRVAKEHFHPERTITAVVGPAAVVLAKDEEHQASLEAIGKVTMLKGE
jgi:predicted Zn-dependent peptidase